MRVTGVISLCLLGCLSVSPRAAEAFISPYLDFFYLGGHTGYEIQGEVPGGQTPGPFKSKLTFRFDNIAIRGGSYFDVTDKIQLRFGGWSTLDENVGQVSNRDWLENGKIYVWSTSEQQVHAWGLGGEFRYWLVKKDTFSLAPAGQILYDDYFFEAIDPDQHSTDPRYDTGKVYGEASTYGQHAVSLLAGVVLQWRPVSWFQIEWTGSFIPIAAIWEEDDHVIRDLLAKGEAAAFGAQTALCPEFIVFKRVRLGLWANYLYMDDYDAEQVQVYYSGPYKERPATTVDNTITREIWAAGGRVVVDLF